MYMEAAVCQLAGFGLVVRSAPYACIAKRRVYCQGSRRWTGLCATHWQLTVPAQPGLCRAAVEPARRKGVLLLCSIRLGFGLLACCGSHGLSDAECTQCRACGYIPSAVQVCVPTCSMCVHAACEGAYPPCKCWHSPLSGNICQSAACVATLFCLCHSSSAVESRFQVSAPLVSAVMQPLTFGNPAAPRNLLPSTVCDCPRQSCPDCPRPVTFLALWQPAGPRLR